MYFLVKYVFGYIRQTHPIRLEIIYHIGDLSLVVKFQSREREKLVKVS